MATRPTRATPMARSNRSTATTTSRARATTTRSAQVQTPRSPSGARQSSPRLSQRSSPPAVSTPARQPARVANEKEADGRRLRAARNYEAVVGAVIEIVREFPPNVVYLPSAAEVAARAQVSERTVFRHFADLDALFVAASSRIRPTQLIYLEPRPDSPDLNERVEALVGLRAKLYERIAPVRRVAIYLSQTHPLVVEQLAEAYAIARSQVADVFAPELSRLDARGRSLMLDALDLASSWSSWDALRTLQGCSVPRTRKIVTKVLTDLLATVPKAKRR